MSIYRDGQYFNPEWIPNLLAWVTAKDPGANGVLPSNGTGIATWKDKSRNGFDFTQATGANQPVFTTNSINGFPSLSFNGSSQYIRCANTALAQQITTEVTVFFTFSVPSGTLFPDIFSTDPADNPPRVNLQMPFGGTSGAIFDFGDAGSGRLLQVPWGGSANTNYVVSATASVSLSTQSYSLNNVVQATSTTPQTCSFGTLYQFTIGALNTTTTPADFFTGVIGEFCIWNRHLNSTENALVYNYFKNGWGI